ncbi:MAG TPA: Gfo/Idh/MocA family oxidoreductase [Campylobacterales bacterium]|nr:Gfo/Idh/MocA family oxidoreductase [Campylobacterales bacterium]
MIDVLVVGTGEYVTGLADTSVVASDKSFGVIALSLFDMRDRGLIGNISLVGRNGKRFSAIREHFNTNLKGAYPTLNVDFISYPKEDLVDEAAYKEALKNLPKGSAVLVFTPDDTHFTIARDALNADMQVLVAKPLVKTVAEHKELMTLSEKKNRLLMLEVHKRFDPIYADAVDEIRTFGDFSYFNAYMSQPKSQLETFKAWAGISSDISYYLNSHHVDLLSWALQGKAKPLSVYASASTGVADSLLKREVEDTITLTIQWKNIQSGNMGTSIHTASWIAPKADVHSQQRFFYMGHRGEINIDQAHRGYTISVDDKGFKSANPLFMKYTPREGKFAGQNAYGYQSIAHFIESSIALKEKKTTLEELNKTLPTIENTLQTTAILEAGYKSLRSGKSEQI